MARELRTFQGGADAPVLLDVAPLPDALPGPDEELEAALGALRGTDATVDQLIDALLGRAGRKGRIAGRPV